MCQTHLYDTLLLGATATPSCLPWLPQVRYVEPWPIALHSTVSGPIAWQPMHSNPCSQFEFVSMHFHKNNRTMAQTAIETHLKVFDLSKPRLLFSLLEQLALGHSVAKERAVALYWKEGPTEGKTDQCVLRARAHRSCGLPSWPSLLAVPHAPRHLNFPAVQALHLNPNCK